MASTYHHSNSLFLGGLLILAQGSVVAPFHLHIYSSNLSMYILGLSAFYHDSAACLLKDGEIVAAAQEERFTRKKHDAEAFLRTLSNIVLKEAGIDSADKLKTLFFMRNLF
jgi:hypothetical protein